MIKTREYGPGGRRSLSIHPPSIPRALLSRTSSAAALSCGSPMKSPESYPHPAGPVENFGAPALPLPAVYPDQIASERIDADATKVLKRLTRHGHTAYLVGGGVRDLLLGRSPKDFDVAT